MNKKPKVTAIIAAAGSSARMGFPKLLHNLDGDLSVLSLSVKAMFENEFVDEVIVVTKKEFFDIALKECEKFSLNNKLLSQQFHHYVYFVLPFLGSKCHHFQHHHVQLHLYVDLMHDF